MPLKTLEMHERVHLLLVCPYSVHLTYSNQQVHNNPFILNSHFYEGAVGIKFVLNYYNPGNPPTAVTLYINGVPNTLLYDPTWGPSADMASYTTSLAP